MASVQPKQSIDSLCESLRQPFDWPGLDAVRPDFDPILLPADLPPGYGQPEGEHGYAGRGCEPPPHPWSMSSTG
jgi:hypothetical protein